MSNTINADNGVVSGVAGLKYSADTSGQLILQTNTTNALTLDTNQNATFATGILATNPFTGTYTDGTIVDYITGVGRINVGPSDDIAFYHNGIGSRTEIARFTYTGRLGIGTATPSYILDISSPAATNGVIAVRSVASQASYLSLAGNANTPLTSSFDLIQDQTYAYVYQRANSPMLFGTNNTERMRITSTGYVCIGTTSADLGIVTVDGGGLAVRSGNNIFLRPTGNAWDMRLQAVGLGLNIVSGGDPTNPIASFVHGGNVGIGTSSPRFKLSIGATTSTSTATPDTIDLGGTYSSTAGANPKLRVWYDGSAYMGLGVSSSQLDYIASSSYNHVWYTNGTEKMRLTAAGYLGINTSGPNTYLDIETATAWGTATTPAIQIGNTGSAGTVTNPQGLGAITWTTNSSNNAANIEAVRTNPSSGNATALVFRNNITGGSSTTLTETLRIDTSGNLAIQVANTSILNSSGRPMVKQTGGILQVQQTFFTTQGSSTSTSFTDLMTLSITPSTTSSKVLIMAQVMLTSYNNEVELRWTRNGTAIGIADAAGSRVRATVTSMYPTADTNHNAPPFVMIYLDSPSSSSAVTYAVQMKVQSGGTMYYNRFASFADNSDWATVSTCTLTAMEVAQ